MHKLIATNIRLSYSSSMRTINKTLLRKKVAEQGLEMIAVKSKCSASLMQKLVSDAYKGVPSLNIAIALCEAVGEKVEDLFPEVTKEEV